MSKEVALKDNTRARYLPAKRRERREEGGGGGERRRRRGILSPLNSAPPGRLYVFLLLYLPS